MPSGIYWQANKIFYMTDHTTSSSLIIVTGAAGFIGSCLVQYLNAKGHTNLVLVDAFDRPDKVPNLAGKQFVHQVEREQLFDWLAATQPNVSMVVHLGARTDTTEFDYSIHEKLNVVYTQRLWQYCTRQQVPLIYASSAATYGGGELGYDDDHQVVDQLQPLNPYGISKNEVDKWVLQQEAQPPFWAGLKFFNVYGPNEYHKGRMASVIFHSVNQIREQGFVKLFRSHKEGFADGAQLRDFVYVKDVIAVCYWLMEHRPASALYNLGTGEARSFKDLATATFAGMQLAPDIRYIDMPEDLRDKYQYFTQANMSKLRAAGYTQPFYTLEEGVQDYVAQYLVPQKYY
jgi:ADP-L-glycero-D-manno-heptose 6-epimerase